MGEVTLRAASLAQRARSLQQTDYGRSAGLATSDPSGAGESCGSKCSDAPTLPAGHPFENVQTFFPYWSATTTASDTSSAWTVNFSNGGLIGVGKHNGMLVWCVRGGQGVDPQ